MPRYPKSKISIQTTPAYPLETLVESYPNVSSRALKLLPVLDLDESNIVVTKYDEHIIDKTRHSNAVVAAKAVDESTDKKEKYFRFNAAKTYLTYSQCKIDPLEFIEKFKKKIDGVTNYLIGQEHHQDGNLHLHCLIFFKEKKDYSCSRCFDIDGHHPHVVTIGRRSSDIENIERYIAKEGFNVIKNYELYKDRPDYGDIIQTSKTHAEFMANVENAKPDLLLKCFNSVMSFANYKYGNPTKKPREYIPRFPKESFKNIPQALMNWINDELPKTDRAKCLFLFGETRFGKTSFIRSLGRHIYMKGEFNLDAWDNDAKYIVFDDMDDINNLKYRKSLLTCAGECTITDKYRGKITVICDKPAIVLLNTEVMPQWLFGQDPTKPNEKVYWQKNGVVVYIDEQLF